MIIKVGKFTIKDWELDYDGLSWRRDNIVRGKHYDHISIDRVGRPEEEYFVMFWGDLFFLEALYNISQRFNSIGSAKESVDNFLIRINKLTVFL
jgi:hypothetical protein